MCRLAYLYYLLILFTTAGTSQVIGWKTGFFCTSQVIGGKIFSDMTYTVSSGRDAKPYSVYLSIND